MNVLENLKKIASQFASATVSIKGQLQTLRAEGAQKRQELVRARDYPLPLGEDLSRRLAAYVADRGAAWIQEHGAALFEIKDSFGDPRLQGPVSVRVLEEPVSFAMLCAGVPDTALFMLERWSALTTREVGPSLSERDAIVARLQAEIDEIEDAEEALIGVAHDAGVEIARRPEVEARRVEEAARATRDADWVEARQHDLENKQIVMTPGAGGAVSSEYLAESKRGIFQHRQ